MLKFVTKRLGNEIEPFLITLYICKSKKKDAIMGVHWQNNRLYQGYMDLKNSGPSVAEQNAAANPYGSHSFGGLLISQLIPQLLIGGGELLADKSDGLNGSQDTGSETDVGGSTNVIHSFNEAKRKYDSAVAKNDNEGILKYAQELQKIGEEHKGEPVIDRGYSMIRSKIENAIKNNKTA